MNTRCYAICLAIVAALGAVPIAVDKADTASAAADTSAAAVRWQSVTFESVRVRVPASWPVIRFASSPAACPRLDVHAVYLGTPGADPICPAGLVGRTEAVMVTPLPVGSPAAATAGAPDAARMITDDLPGAGLPGAGLPGAGVHGAGVHGAGVRVTISYRADRALALAIRSSIRVTASAGHTVASPGSARPGSATAASSAGAHARAGAARTPRRGMFAGSVFSGGGFDSCAAPSAGTMTKWLASSYRAVGVYIGGVNRACAQANLTTSWLTGIVSQGWQYFPIYPGLQSSCVLASGDATISSAHAAAQGRAAADDAAAQAAGLGIGKGTPLTFDMEAYGPSCDAQVVTFLSAWDAELNARGYRSGVYESFTNIGALVAASGLMTEPDVIYYADWDGKATTTSSYMPHGMWTDHARIHQYLGGHLETHGGVTINVDSDQLDVSLGGGTVPGAGHRGYRIALAINSNGTAEWFARSAASVLAHSWQQPVGSLTWSAPHTVGQSPTTIVSNPSAVAQADGRLTVFARDRAGQVEHAWQQPGFPNDWEWGTPLAASPQPPLGTADPAAVLIPGGIVGVFETLADGSVAVTRQLRPSHNARWAAWVSIGGSCAGTPVPVVDAGKGTDVFCVTLAGTAAFDRWNGKAWSGWSTLPGSPSNLRGVPSVVLDGSREIEFFAATRSAGLDDAWSSGSPGARGAWTWGSPLAGRGSAPAAGTTIAGSPAAATWPSGHVIVYARLAGGQVGYIRHFGTAGPASWSGWATVGGVPGGKMLGSPAGWLNSSGAAGVAALDRNLMLAVSANTGSGWASWTEVGGGF